MTVPGRLKPQDVVSLPRRVYGLISRAAVNHFVERRKEIITEQTHRLIVRFCKTAVFV